MPPSFPAFCGSSARRTLLTLAAASALLALVPGVARAQEWTTRDCRPIEPSELAQGDVFNRRLMIEVTTSVISGLQIVAAETDVRLELARDIRDQADRVREGDRIRAFGFVARDPQSGGRVFYVRRLEGATASSEQLAAELIRLRALGDAAGLLTLGDRATSLGASGGAKDGPELERVAREAYRLAAELESQSLDPKDRQAVLRLAQIYGTRLGDRARALALLVSLLEGSGAVPLDVDQRLREIRAVRYGRDRRWVLFEDMKRAEGFVEHRGQWVKPERAQLLDAALERQGAASQLRDPALETVYLDAAKTRQLLHGMVKREVRVARGFPARFDRVRVGTRTYDAWWFEDDSALFFEDDVLFRK